MSSEAGEHIEQDRAAPAGGAELPTYDDLAEQNGPNSRFGRWRGWIEKRAAERYADVSPAERARRRERGWGNDGVGAGIPQVNPVEVDVSPPSLSGLHIQTHDLPTPSEQSDPQSPCSSLPPLPFKSQILSPSHLKLNQFGSRFLPHTTSPIRCLLPLDSGRLLLIGHDDGLSVLDMFPKEWCGRGIVIKGPDEARARHIWQGESVYQMSLLEVETASDGTLQGVVLLLVGSDSDAHSFKDTEPMRSLRMHNLASLIALAKWTISQEGSRPLDLKRPSKWQVQQSPPRRSKVSIRAHSLTPFKSFIDNSPSRQTQDPFGSSCETLSPSTPSKPLKPSFSARGPNKRTSLLSVLTPNRRDTDDGNWDVVDDLPLRWATDFVPLAPAGSRLINCSVLSYALQSDDNRKGGHLLAVATKSIIFLYESLKGERAFRFVKEFYTPLQPRSVTFFQQYVQEGSHARLDMGYSHRRTNSNVTILDGARIPLPAPLRYGTHLSLFVVFDKKAGWIRLADSAVDEVELYDTRSGPPVAPQIPMELMNTGSILRNRVTSDAIYHPPRWLPIVRCKLPPSDNVSMDAVYLLSRGKQTHIVPCPLPASSMPIDPLFSVRWRSTPGSVSARVYDPSARGKGSEEREPFLQLIALGEDGVEVQELSFSFLGKGKGKARPVEEVTQALEDLGGDTGFLCTGGHWDQWYRLYGGQLDRSTSTLSSNTAMSSSSYDSMETDVLKENMLREEGIYAWYHKGVKDWRIFWVGGSSDVGDDGPSDDDFP